jgi:hypothetical protein
MKFLSSIVVLAMVCSLASAFFLPLNPEQLQQFQSQFQNQFQGQLSNLQGQFPNIQSLIQNFQNSIQPLQNLNNQNLQALLQDSRFQQLQSLLRNPQSFQEFLAKRPEFRDFFSRPFAYLGQRANLDNLLNSVQNFLQNSQLNLPQNLPQNLQQNFQQNLQQLQNAIQSLLNNPAFSLQNQKLQDALNFLRDPKNSQAVQNFLNSPQFQNLQNLLSNPQQLQNIISNIQALIPNGIRQQFPPLAPLRPLRQ